MSLPIFLSAITAFFFLAGIIFGSYGNVVVIRGIAGRSTLGRSACMACGKILGMLELVPVVSFLALKAKCRWCRKPISWQYPLVELASGLLFALALWQESFQLFPAALLAFCLWLLLLIAIFDLQTGLIPDALSIPLVALALVRSLWFGPLPFIPLLIVLGFFGGQWLLSRGRWLGSGDIILAWGIALLLPRLEIFLVALFASYIIGAAFACVLLIRKKKKMDGALPFGPFLVIGAMFALFFGDATLRFLLP